MTINYFATFDNPIATDYVLKVSRNIEKIRIFYDILSTKMIPLRWQVKVTDGFTARQENGLFVFALQVVMFKMRLLRSFALSWT